MATNAQLLATLGRLIAQASGGIFDAADRQAHLNAAKLLAEERIREIAPQLFTRRATAPIAIGDDGTRARYGAPTSENVSCVEIRTSASDSYRQMRKIKKEQALAWSGEPAYSTDGTLYASTVYYEEGNEYVLVPTPSADVVAGLRATFYVFVALSAAADVPRMPEHLHRTLAYGAAVFALEESKDASDSVVDTYRQRWASKFGPIEASTEESRAALALSFRQHEPRILNGTNFG